MNTVETIRKPRIGFAQALLLFVILFVGVYWAEHALSGQLEPHFHLETLCEKAAYKASVAIVFDWVAFGAMLLVLRLRGQTFRDLGWRKRASLMGWLTAAAVAAIYAGYTVLVPLKNAPMLTDWSFYRISLAVSVGLTAGICEEAIFRGFVMTQTRDAGAATWLQILLAAILFGLAHAGWGGMASGFSVTAAIGAMMATAIVGAMLAGVYVLSRRSLMPAIFAHAVIDMIIEPWLILFALSGGFTHMH